MFNSRERTLREIVSVCASAGWKVVKVNQAPGSLFGYITAAPILASSEETSSRIRQPTRRTRPSTAIASSSSTRLPGNRRIEEKSSSASPSAVPILASPSGALVDPSRLSHESQIWSAALLNTDDLGRTKDGMDGTWDYRTAREMSPRFPGRTWTPTPTPKQESSSVVDALARLGGGVKKLRGTGGRGALGSTKSFGDLKGSRSVGDLQSSFLSSTTSLSSTAEAASHAMAASEAAALAKAAAQPSSHLPRPASSLKVVKKKSAPAMSRVQSPPPIPPPTNPPPSIPRPNAMKTRIPPPVLPPSPILPTPAIAKPIAAPLPSIPSSPTIPTPEPFQLESPVSPSSPSPFNYEIASAPRPPPPPTPPRSLRRPSSLANMKTKMSLESTEAKESAPPVPSSVPPSLSPAQQAAYEKLSGSGRTAPKSGLEGIQEVRKELDADEMGVRRVEMAGSSSKRRSQTLRGRSSEDQLSNSRNRDMGGWEIITPPVVPSVPQLPPANAPLPPKSSIPVRPRTSGGGYGGSGGGGTMLPTSILRKPTSRGQLRRASAHQHGATVGLNISSPQLQSLSSLQTPTSTTESPPGRTTPSLNHPYGRRSQAGLGSGVQVYQHVHDQRHTSVSLSPSTTSAILKERMVSFGSAGDGNGGTGQPLTVRGDRGSTGSTTGGSVANYLKGAGQRLGGILRFDSGRQVGGEREGESQDMRETKEIRKRTESLKGARIGGSKLPRIASHPKIERGVKFDLSGL